MTRTAVIAGVGPGLGESLARKFATEGCTIGLLARTEQYLEQLAVDIDTDTIAVPTDITKPTQIEDAFTEITDELGEVDILVNHAGGGGWDGVQGLTRQAFENAWRTCAYGGFVCSKQVIPSMVESGEGTIIFTGATSAIRGRSNAAGFASAKFAVRGLAESMARELGPQGIHVTHVIIDGQILTPQAADTYPNRDPETFLDPDAIAQTYWDVVEQDRSAWTLEYDVRPHVEEF